MEQDYSQLRLSPEERAELLEQMEEVLETRPVRLVMARLEALHRQNLQLLVAADNPLSMQTLQGQVRGVELALAVPSDLIREIKNGLAAEPAANSATIEG